MSRKNLTATELANAVSDVRVALKNEIEKKGNHACASIHEALGVIDEEHHELKTAVQSNDHTRVVEELLDIAVACTWAIASIKAKKVDW